MWFLENVETFDQSQLTCLFVVQLALYTGINHKASLLCVDVGFLEISDQSQKVCKLFVVQLSALKEIIKFSCCMWFLGMWKPLISHRRLVCCSVSSIHCKKS